MTPPNKTLNEVLPPNIAGHDFEDALHHVLRKAETERAGRTMSSTHHLKKINQQIKIEARRLARLRINPDNQEPEIS